MKKELSLNQDIYEEKLSQAMIMERLTSYGPECSTLGENWKYEDLFERELVSPKTHFRQETMELMSLIAHCATGQVTSSEGNS